MAQPEVTMALIQSIRQDLAVLEREILDNHIVTAKALSTSLEAHADTLDTNIQALDPDNDNSTVDLS